MSLSRAEKLEKLKALRESEKKKNIDVALASLDDLDIYLNKYNLEELQNDKKPKNNISELIAKFNNKSN